MFYTRTRNYESCLHRALDKNNIPIEVYHSLIRNVRDNLDTFHRYLRLRKRMLGVDTLKYSDLYAPVVKDLDLQVHVRRGPGPVPGCAQAPGRGLSPGGRARRSSSGGSTCIRRRANAPGPTPTAAPTTCTRTFC